MLDNGNFSSWILRPFDTSLLFFEQFHAFSTNILGPFCTIPALAMKLTISLRSPNSCQWRMKFRSQYVRDVCTHYFPTFLIGLCHVRTTSLLQSVSGHVGQPHPLHGFAPHLASLLTFHASLLCGEFLPLPTQAMTLYHRPGSYLDTELLPCTDAFLIPLRH